MMTAVLLGVGCLLAAPHFLPDHLQCRWLGWHRRPHRIGFDGASLAGTCPCCGARVLQDSQGNWFAVSRPGVDS